MDAKFAGFFSLSFQENALLLLWKILTPPSTARNGAKMKRKRNYSGMNEERSGGVAAIEQPR